MNQQKDIFVVDDDASIRDSLRDLLGSAGLNVQTFASAQEFLVSPNTMRPVAWCSMCSSPG